MSGSNGRFVVVVGLVSAFRNLSDCLCEYEYVDVCKTGFIHQFKLVYILLQICCNMTIDYDTGVLFMQVV